MCTRSVPTSVRKSIGAFAVCANFGGIVGTVLLDTGADSCFISKQTVSDMCLPIIPSVRKVATAAGHNAIAQGYVHTFVRMYDHIIPVQAWVLPSLPSTFDLILGCDVLCRHRVRLDVGARAIEFMPPVVPSVTHHPMYTNTADRFLTGISAEARPGTAERVNCTPSISPVDGTSVPEQTPAQQSPNIASRVTLTCSLSHAQKLFERTPMPQAICATARIDLYGREVAEGEPVWDLGPTGLDNVPHTELKALLEEFSDVFPADIPPGIPPDRGLKLSVFPLLPGAKPIRSRQYRISPIERAELERQVEHMEQMGWCRPSTSPWAHPVTFAGKGEGQGLRCCMDYRNVNGVTRRNAAPLPRMDDLIDSVHGIQVMSSLDLAAGYHQIPLLPEECERSAFHCGSRLMEFTVMPFGPTNAPAVFSEFMNSILRELIKEGFVLVYLDDVLVISRSPAEHIQHLRRVIQVFRDKTLYCRPHKCKFNVQELPYLGHLLTTRGVKPDPRKVQIVNDWHCPLVSIKEVEQFTGLVNYFRKYIRGYGHVCAPLNALKNKKVPFVWTQQCTNSMTYLKQALTASPILAAPDHSETAAAFELVSDASGLGVGACLLQGGSVVAYEGRKYKPAEANYTVGEQELLAVVNALQVWRCYLEGAPRFTVVTDHNPLIWLQTQKTLSRRQARWSEFMQRFDFGWVYRPGRINVADPISRAPSLLDSARDAPPDAEIFMCLAHMGLIPDGDRLAPSVPAVGPSSPLSTSAERAPHNRPTRASAHSVCTVVSCLRGRSHPSEGGENTQPIGCAAATRGGAQYNSELIDPSDTTPEQMPSQVSDEVRRQAPPLWEGASGSNGVLHEAQTSVRNSDALESDQSAMPNRSARQSADSTMPVTSSRASTDVKGRSPSSTVIHDDGLMLQELDEFLGEVLAGYQQDPWFEELTNTRTLVRDTKGLYWKGHSLVIPDHGLLRTECVSLCHDAPWAAHLGRDKTMALVSSMYYWPGISDAVRQHVNSCLQCQRNKPSNRKPAGLMVPTQIPERRWSSISVDFITQLPRTERGHDAVTVFVDRLSKRVHYVPTTTQMTAETFACTFVQTIFANHGLPQEIISDRDSKFISAFWKEVSRMLGVQRCLSTAFHPRSDGQTERANRTLEEALRAYVCADQTDWDDHLPLVEFAVNNSWHSAIGTTPFLMEYGQTPLTPGSVPLNSQNPAANKFVGNWAARVKLAKDQFRVAQERAKSYFDKKVETQSFAVGDQVLLASKNLKFKGQGLGERTKKLMPRFIGPFAILARVGLVAYRIGLPPTVKVHPVFHVSLLKAYSSDGRYQPPPAKLDLIGEEVHYQIGEIASHRMGGSKKQHSQYLVHWTGYDSSFDTWEWETDLCEDAPTVAPALIAAYHTRQTNKSDNALAKKRKKG